MEKDKKSKYLLAGLVVATSLVSFGVAAQTPSVSPNAARQSRPVEDREQLERRLVSVVTLIERSSAAKQIEASGNPEALALRAKAGEMRDQADKAYKAGDFAGASRLLDQAAKMLFDGVRLAAPEQVTGEKKLRDFNNRLDSVKALMDAQKRINDEKKQGAKGSDMLAALDKKMRDAQALVAGGDLDKGRALLDQVYVQTRTAIELMRDGDTLVRSLNFATKEEEYVYEVDRNDTHLMLTTVLLSEKRAANPTLDSSVQKYLDAAANLRKSAEGMAAKKDFESAIKLLENSTAELVRAIRGAGVYIPG
jgi:hypothetical protein